ncbi:MAG: 50S ribosomal protein L11 methyltransferase [Kiritimatiellia bacterium]
MPTPDTQMQTVAQKLETLIVEAPAQDRELIEAALAALPTQGYACWTPIESGQDRHDAFFEDADDADRARNALNLQRLAQPAPESWTITRTSLAETDWANAWKVHFQIEKVSPRIVIRPVWEPYEAQAEEIVIHIDPGMSFGTGRHETTRSCLRMLDSWTANGNTGSFLDLGCGSGILSIAAAKLGLQPITALDYDPDAVQGASENIARNELSSLITPCVGDVGNLQRPDTFDMVAANILAPVLIEHAQAIGETVKTGGFLILSGILETQYECVHATYTALHFEEVERIKDGEWTSGRFEKRAE